MHAGWSEELVRDRNARALAEAEERRLARMVARADGRSLRARAARRLFGFAVTLEREETWRVVWERLEAPRHREISCGAPAVPRRTGHRRGG